MIEIREVRYDELAQLREVAVASYLNTFASYNTPENMEMFLRETYALAQFERELTEKNAICYLAWEAKDALGFVRLRANNEVENHLGTSALELHRLYIHPDHQGKKIGSLLMHQALEYAASRGFEWMWLGVWERNIKAQEFYKLWGFQKFSEHIFQMGDDPQTDWLLRKKLI